MNFANIARRYLEVPLVSSESISFDTMIGFIDQGIELAESINFSPGVYYPEKDNFQVDSEVGDDHVAFTRSPHVPLMESTMAMALYDMEISVPDTFVSKVYCTFTGKVAVMPQDHFDHYSQTKVKKEGGDKQTIVVDLPALRSVVNVNPQVKVNTSSLEGRLNYMSRSIDYSSGTNEEKIVNTISILQDITHCVFTQGDKFPYLPSFMGGYDKPVPFGSKENLDRALFAYKRGRYRKLVYTVLDSFYGILFRGERETDFIREIKSLYSGYQAWYVNYKRNFPLFSGKLPPDFWRYKIPEQYGSSAITSMVLRRLTAEGVLVKERDLVVANEVQSYFKSLISEDIDLFQEAKRSVEKKFSSETKLSNCFQELVQGSFDVVILDDIEDHIKEWATEIRISDSRLYRNAFGGERLFWREALDEIYLKSPLKVTFPLNGEKYKIMRLGRPEPGQLTDDDEPAVRRLADWVKGDMEKYPFPPQEILEDDDVLVGKIFHSKDKFLASGSFPAVLIITNDSKLCERANMETSVPVIRLPPEFLLVKRTGRFNVIPAADPLKFFQERLSKRVPGFMSSTITVDHDNHVFADFGSWDASSVRFDTQPFMKKVLSIEVRSDQIFEYRVLGDTDPISRLRARLEAWPIGHIFDNERLIKLSEFSSSEDWRKREDRPWFNPMAIFNRASKTRARSNDVLIGLVRSGIQGSIYPASIKEREKLLSLPSSQ
jgi:hypothetical protein